MKTIITLIALTSMFSLFATEANAAQCTVDLKSERSARTIDTFRGYGYSLERACREAIGDCRDAIRRGRYGGRSRRLTCVKRRNHRLVTKTCSVNMVSRHGRFLDSFTGVATGRMELSLIHI